MSNQIFDTHCHLLNLNQNSTLSESSHYLSVSTERADWLKLSQLQQKNIYIALGIHPWFVTHQSLEDLRWLENNLTSVSINAIGEIGLDFFPEFLKIKSLQIEVFEQQLFLASKNHFPVSIHCRKAFEDVYRLVRQYSVTGFMHGFSGSMQQANLMTQLGFKIGIGTAVLKPNAKKSVKLLESLDLNHLVLETDYPYAKNKTSHYALNAIELVAAKVAEIKELPIEKVYEITTHNAKDVLKNVD